MATRDSASPSRGVLSGRGGAGNFGKENRTNITPEDLDTPTLKSEHYTTGRGGSGNIARNDSAAEARLAQDVEAQAVKHHEEQNLHYGRGGAANVIRAPSKDRQENPKKRTSSETIAEKGKDFLDRLVHNSKH